MVGSDDPFLLGWGGGLVLGSVGGVKPTDADESLRQGDSKQGISGLVQMAATQIWRVLQPKSFVLSEMRVDVDARKSLIYLLSQWLTF